MSSDAQRRAVNHAILVVDPFLKSAIENMMREGLIGNLSETTFPDIVFTKSWTNELALLTFADSQYLAEAILEVKVLGVRKMVFLDVATALKPSLKVSQAYPVYATSSPVKEDFYLPLVPSVQLFNAIIELLKPEREVIAFTSRLPPQDIAITDLLKKKGFDVIDKNSGLIYKVCRGSVECVVLDLIDSNLAKGIEKGTVWEEGGKYYSGILVALTDLFKKLLSAEL